MGSLQLRVRRANLVRGKVLDWEAIRSVPKRRDAPPLFTAYLLDRVARLERAGFRSAADYLEITRNYYVPTFAGFLVTEVEIAHVREFVAQLSATKLSASRIHNIYNVGRVACADLVAEAVLERTPFALRRGELPRRSALSIRRRLDVEWVGRLLSDARVPLYWRALFATLFLTGRRIGEVLSVTWGAWEPLAPLGRLTFITAYDSRKKKNQPSSKTGAPHQLPVHPVLARFLDLWRANGWPRVVGRPPGPDDLIFPRVKDGAAVFRTSHGVLKRLKRDLERNSIPEHRTHDARHTFISLLRSARADRAIVKSWTHAKARTAFDAYEEIDWRAQCREMMRLELPLQLLL